MKLWLYVRSSASYRVRIALEIEGISWESATLNLLESERESEAFRAPNPQVPVLVHADRGTHRTQLIRNPRVPARGARASRLRARNNRSRQEVQFTFSPGPIYAASG